MAETAEAHLPLKLHKEGISPPNDEQKIDIQMVKTKESKNVNEDVNVISHHQNGALKVVMNDQMEVDKDNNKVTLTMTEESPHSLWKWPAGQGKFTQVKILYDFTNPILRGGFLECSILNWCTVKTYML